MSSTQELLGNKITGGNTPDVNDITNSYKKKKKTFKSMFEEQLNKGIVQTKPLEEQLVEQSVVQIQQVQQKEQAAERIQQRGSLVNKAIPVEQEQNQKFQETVKADIELVTEQKLPENIDAVATETDIVTSLNEIPDGNQFDITDVKIVASKEKKDKSGYYKTTVKIKKENIPEQINIIATYVKKASKGIIKPRVCDLRLIANTNKTQLKGSALKLSAATVVFKPDNKKLKVNKGTRFMISIPDNYESTGNLLIYIQESRSKKILELTPKDFPNLNLFNEFIGDRIAEYFFNGYDVVLPKLQMRNTNNPLMTVLTNILNTREFKGKPHIAEDHVFAIEIISNGEKNQWLHVMIIEDDMPGSYNVILQNKVDASWEYQVNSKAVTLGYLDKNIIQLLNDSYAKEWDIISDGLDEIYYQHGLLSHAKLKKSLMIIYDKSKDEPERGIIIKKVLTKKDNERLMKGEYDAESIIGKTENIDYFILTYLAYPIIGGDKRNGEDYITKEEYYDKYDVKDRRNYDERGKTILKKEGESRNYNSRIYLYQIEYSFDGKKNIYRDNDFGNLLKQTGFLSDEPQLPKTIY